MRLALSAHQWHTNGDHPDDGPAGREGRVVRYFRHPDIPGDHRCPRCAHTAHEHGWIDSGGPGRTVCPGDWIVQTAKGHMPVGHDVFFTLARELTTA